MAYSQLSPAWGRRASCADEAWYRDYKAAGLEVIGVHTPEYAFEHVPSNVQSGIRRLGITYPVALDNKYTTWNNFGNDSWPADYLIDSSGNVRHGAIGEGGSGTHTFTLPPVIPDGQWSIAGTWTIGSQAITAGQGATIKLNFRASEVYLDVGGTGTVTATVNGKTTTYKVSGAPDIYPLVHSAAQERALLQVRLSPGLSAYSFTFG